jgi:tripeptidyl-peptidase-1
VGVATGVPVTFVSVGEDSQDGDLGGFLDIVNFLAD